MVAKGRELMIARLGESASYDVVAETVWMHLGQRDGGTQSLSSIHVIHDDFAIARVDRWSETDTTILTIFKEAGSWRIVGEATVRADSTAGSEMTTAGAEAVEVLRVMNTYYRAVEAGDAGLLAGILEPKWLMWNHRQGGEVVREHRATFLRRVGGVPLPGYGSDRKIADVQIIHGRLACVRVDKPSTATVTVFLLNRSDTDWRIVENAWSNGIGE